MSRRGPARAAADLPIGLHSRRSEVFLNARQRELAPFALGDNLHPAQLHNDWGRVAQPPQGGIDGKIEAMFDAAEERHRQRRRRSRRRYLIVERLFWVTAIISVCFVFAWAGPLVFRS